MKAIRLFLYFLIGVAFSAVAVLAHAESVAAYWTIVPTNGSTGAMLAAEKYATATEAGTRGCSYRAGTISPAQTGTFTGYNSDYGRANCTFSVWTGVNSGGTMGQSCPAGSGATGSAPNVMCSFTTPCSVGQIRNAITGFCEASPCHAGDSAAADYFGGWRVGKASNALVGADGGAYSVPPPVTVCDGACSITVTASGTCASSGLPYVDTPQPVNCHGTGVKTGATCSVSSALPGTPPVIASHKPKCAAGEGVLTSSSGTVACVGSAVKAETPAVSTARRVETFGDGTTKTTETTKTVVPSDGTADTSVKTTSTGGQSGTAGTTTTSEATATDRTEPERKKATQDDACDPKSQMCGTPGTEGIYTKKDKTVNAVISSFSDGIKGSGAGSAMTGFFTVSTPGGSCPNWQVTVPVINTTLNISENFCTSTALSMMDLVGAVLLAVASFVGFRWAIL